MLINLLKDHKPDGVARGLRPPRADVPPRGRSPTYKANREAAPDILRQQMGLVREVLDALGDPHDRAAPASRPTTSSPRSPTQAEADGRRRRSSSPATATATSSSSDPHVKVLYNRRGVSDYALYDEAGIVERTGVTPGAVPAVRGAARRPERQPARRARRGGEDGGQADQHLRRPRRDLRQRRRRRRRSCGRRWPSTRRGRGTNPELMVLRRDAPIERRSRRPALGVRPTPTR